MMIALSPIDLIALGCVVFIGLPHGAFDGAIYALLPNKQKGRSLPLFLISYSAMALLVTLLWLIAPLPSLIGFLALSCFHFGKGDSIPPQGHDTKGWERLVAIIAHGGLVTIYLPLIHSDAAFSYFASLTFRTLDDLALFSALFPIAGLLWLAALISYAKIALKSVHHRARFIEVIGAAALMAWLPILPAFAFYFCAIHSRRHFLHLYHSTKSQAPRTVLPLGLGLMIASWLAGLGALLIASMYQSFAVSAIQIIFIGLAALTVPHMILVDGLWRPLSKQSHSAK